MFVCDMLDRSKDAAEPDSNAGLRQLGLLVSVHRDAAQSLSCTALHKLLTGQGQSLLANVGQSSPYATCNLTQHAPSPTSSLC